MGIWRGNRGRRSPPASSPPPHRRRRTAAQTARHRQGIRAAHAAKTAAPAGLDHPGSEARAANGAAGHVTYNEPLPSAAMPTVTPAVPGSWTRRALGRFHARRRVRRHEGDGHGRGGPGYRHGDVPHHRLSRPALRCSGCSRSWRSSATCRCPGRQPPARRSRGRRAAQYAAAYAPPSGTFSGTGVPVPAALALAAGQRQQGRYRRHHRFRGRSRARSHRRSASSPCGPLLKAAAAGQRDTNGYSYAIASQVLPETLTIWHNGHRVFQSLANTGISIRPTPVYTSPVYSKLPFQVMQGTNPDGSPTRTR